ncbi:hypothetical protein [Pseudomonas umsongensis]
MNSRFRVIETTRMDDGIKQYRVVDLVEGDSASKHEVYKARVEAVAVFSPNAEHPRQSGVARTSNEDQPPSRVFKWIKIKYAVWGESPLPV